MSKTYSGGVVDRDSIAQGFAIDCDTTTAGSGVADNWLFEVLKNNATVMFSKTTNGNEITAHVAYSLTPQGLAARTMTAGDTWQLRVTKTGNPTDLSTATLDGDLALAEALA